MQNFRVFLFHVINSAHSSIIIHTLTCHVYLSTRSKPRSSVLSSFSFPFFSSSLLFFPLVYHLGPVRGWKMQIVEACSWDDAKMRCFPNRASVRSTIVEKSSISQQPVPIDSSSPPSPRPSFPPLSRCIRFRDISPSSFRHYSSTDIFEALLFILG